MNSQLYRRERGGTVGLLFVTLELIELTLHLYVLCIYIFFQAGATDSSESFHSNPTTRKYMVTYAITSIHKRPTITCANYNMLLISHDLDSVGDNFLKRAD